MFQPRVTIVMPVFNAASTIDATIESVLAQTIGSFELIAINDGSSDASLARLLDHAARDQRIHVVSRDNGGVSRARNLGVELGKASYVAFIDADDIWEPTKLARHLALHERAPELAASYARIAFMPQDAVSIAGCRTVSSLSRSPLRLADVLGENPVCSMSNLFMRRDWFLLSRGFDPELSHAEDQEFVAHLIVHGARIEGIDAVLVGYRFSPDGLSMDLARMHEGWRTVATRYMDGPVLDSLEALYCRYLSRRTLRAGGMPRQALGYAWNGLQLDAATFLRDRRRGLATLVAALASPFMPAVVRRHVFA